MTLERWRPRWGMVPWRPFEEMERRFDEFFGRRLPAEEKGWMPAVDMYEKDDKYVIKAELPGIKEEDIDISVAGETLTIKGEKKTEAEVKEENYYRSERTYGSFYRSIPLPSTVDADKIEASFDNGILEVTLPKTARVKPKKIAIAAGKKSK